MKKDRPAFPNPGILETSPLCSMNGKTLREWYAGLAMQGLLANAGGPIQANGMSGWGFVNCKAEDVADVAFKIADEMIKRGVQ